jgi:hypothetical protein
MPESSSRSIGPASLKVYPTDTDVPVPKDPKPLGLDDASCGDDQLERLLAAPGRKSQFVGTLEVKP